jgi:hypothetical protein
MPATITSVTTPGGAHPGFSFNLAGSGFGASQGSSQVFYYPSASNTFLSVGSISGWADVSVSGTLPANAALGSGFLIVRLGSETIGRRSAAVNLTADPTPPTTFQVGDYVISLTRRGVAQPLTAPWADPSDYPRGRITNVDIGAYDILFFEDSTHTNLITNVLNSEVVKLSQSMVNYFRNRGLLP